MRSFALALSVVAMALACAHPAHARVLLEGRAGLGVPLHGDMPDDLNLGLGASFGIKSAYEVSASLAIDLRFDAMWLFGEVSDEAVTPMGWFETVEGEAETSGSVYGISVGPTLTHGIEGIDLYAGAHPGIYFSSWTAEGDLWDRDEGGSMGELESGTSVDLGLNAQLGARFYLTEQLVLGPEIAYHLVFLRDEVKDEMGGFLASVVLGFRY